MLSICINNMINKMEPIPKKLSIEPRWPVVLSCIVVLFLVSASSNSVRIFPDWFRYFIIIIVIFSIAAVPLTGANWLTRRIEHFNVLLMFIIIEIGIFDGLRNLVHVIIYSSQQINGIQLLNLVLLFGSLTSSCFHYFFGRLIRVVQKSEQIMQAGNRIGYFLKPEFLKRFCQIGIQPMSITYFLHSQPPLLLARLMLCR